MPSSRDLPNPGLEPMSLMSPALAGGFLTTSTTCEVARIEGRTSKLGSHYNSEKYIPASALHPRPIEIKF